MQTVDYLSKDIKALSSLDKVSVVQQLFKKLTFTHLPIVEKGYLLGLVSEEDIQTIDSIDKPLADFEYLYQVFFTFEKANWLEVLKSFALNDATILPVLDESKRYIGYYELTDILQVFNSTPFLSENGSILVISKDIQEYSFREIAQIVESNDARLLGAFISKIQKDTVEITVKLSDHDLNTTIQTFRRYGYSILTDFQVDEYLNTLKERSDYLQKYLNI